MPLSLLKNYERSCFLEKHRWLWKQPTNKGIGQRGRHLRENPPGGGSFACGRRWLVPYSPLRGCLELAALATRKIPRRRTIRSFPTGSYVPQTPESFGYDADGNLTND